MGMRAGCIPRWIGSLAAAVFIGLRMGVPVKTYHYGGCLPSFLPSFLSSPPHSTSLLSAPPRFINCHFNTKENPRGRQLVQHIPCFNETSFLLSFLPSYVE